MEPFADREAAGRELATHLKHHRDPLIVGITPGAMVLADVIAGIVGGELGLAPVRRLDAPESHGLVVGAVCADGDIVLDEDLAARLGIGLFDLADQADRARADIRSELDSVGAVVAVSTDRDVILVAEGAASGLRLRAAVAMTRRDGPARLSCALGVAPPGAVDLLAGEVDEVVCPRQPLRLGSLEAWYRVFPAVGADEVRRILWNR